MNFLVLDVKQPKIKLFDVIEGKILVFSVFEAPPSRPSFDHFRLCYLSSQLLSLKNVFQDLVLTTVARDTRTTPEKLAREQAI